MGNPEPPLRLEDIRQLLRLDRAYYSSTSDGVLQETVHRLKLAGKQVLARPSILFDVIRKFDLRALWLPDRKRILINRETPTVKQRWDETHEIGHSIIPWHEPLMHGDHRVTLSRSCHQQVEAEANYAAGRLLFLQDRFVHELRSRKLSFATIKQLSSLFKNTLTSTLWRTVESTDCPTFGLISIHPRETQKDGELPIRHFLRSRSFAESFGNVKREEIFRAMKSFCFGRRGPIGKSDVILNNTDDVKHCFFVECFHVSHYVLTLGVHKGIKATAVAQA